MKWNLFLNNLLKNDVPTVIFPTLMLIDIYSLYSQDIKMNIVIFKLFYLELTLKNKISK